jgi:hypothetical protein
VSLSLVRSISQKCHFVSCVDYFTNKTNRNRAESRDVITFLGLQSYGGSCHAADMADDAKPKKNPAAVALGRLGGLRGGPARAKMLTAAERKASAQKAALARWSKKRKKP